jgi:hypothetical protein
MRSSVSTCQPLIARAPNRPEGLLCRWARVEQQSLKPGNV